MADHSCGSPMCTARLFSTILKPAPLNQEPHPASKALHGVAVGAINQRACDGLAGNQRVPFSVTWPPRCGARGWFRAGAAFPAALSPGTCREGRAGPGAAPQADGSATSLTHGFPPATSFNESSKVMSLI